jgi:hypothetical protein
MVIYLHIETPSLMLYNPHQNKIGILGTPLGQAAM